MSALEEHREHMKNGHSQGPCKSCGRTDTRTYTVRQDCGRKSHTRTCCDLSGIFCRSCHMFHPTGS